MAQAQDVARDRVPGAVVIRRLALHIGHHGRFDGIGRPHGRRLPEEGFVPASQQPGVVIRLAPHHHAVHMLQVNGDLLVGGHTAVQANGQVWEIPFQLIDHLVAQRRNLPVFLRAQALQPGVARMHDEHPASGFADLADEITDETIAFDAVDANAVLHRHRDVHRIHHGLHAVGHQRRLGHQAGAERAALHPLARAAAVQIDLVIAPVLAQLRGIGQLQRLAAAEL